MTIRFLRILLVWVLVLATAWIAEPYVLAVLMSAETPRAVAPRGSFSRADETAIAIFKRVSPSVVHIYAQAASQPAALLGTHESVVQSGSGVVWDAAGHVITNYHVIKGTGRIVVQLTSGEFVVARVVGVAPDYDLAVLQLERVRTQLPPIAVGRSDDLQVGQTVFAIGNPYGLNQTMTSGIVSALNRRLPTASPYEIQGVIQTDAPINPGNSGGPLLDDAGRLIGVNTALVSKTGAFAGIGFAIPVGIVNRIVPQLIRNGRVSVPGIGIVAAREPVATTLGSDGVIASRPSPVLPQR